MLTGDLPALEQLHDHLRRLGPAASVRRAGRLRRRWVADLPGRDRVPEEVTTVPGPSLEVGLDDVAWVDGRLEVSVGLSSDAELPRPAVDLWLQHDDGSATPLPATIDGARARTVLDPESLRVDGRIPRGFRVLTARVQATDLDVTTPVVSPCHGRGRYPGPAALPNVPGLAVQPYRRGEDGFGITVHRPLAQVTGCESAADGLLVRGVLYRPEGATAPQGAALVVTGLAPVPVDLVDVGDHAIWSALVPVEGLTGPLDYADPIALQRMFPARLEVDGDARLVVFAPGARAASVVRGERMVSATRNVAGFLEFVEERHGPVISAITWSGPGSLTVRGTLVGGTTGEAVLRQYPQPGAPVERRAPLTIEGETYAFEIDASSLTAHHAEPWHLLVPVGDRLLTQTFDRTRAADFAAARQVGEGRDDERRVEVLLTRNDVVRIGVR